MDFKFKLHNEFEITVISNDGTEVTHKAYNVVTNRTKYLIANHTSGALNIVTNIALGRGTGEPSATDTTLFSYIGHFAATREYWTNMSSTTKKAVYMFTLEPSQLVGETITEIGFGTSTEIYTHAMIQDAQGNPIGIYKTATDKLVVRATLYYTIDLPDGVYSTQPADASTNDPSEHYLYMTHPWSYLLLNSSRSTSSSSSYLRVTDKLPFATDVMMNTSQLSTATATTHSYNTSENSRTISGNLSSTAYNDKLVATVVHYENSTDLVMPITSSNFPGVNYTDVSIGGGNGVKTDFDIPPYYQNNTSLTVKVNGIEVTDYEIVKSYGVYAGYDMGSRLNCSFYPFPDDENKFLRIYSSPKTDKAMMYWNSITWDQSKNMFVGDSRFKSKQNYYGLDYSASINQYMTHIGFFNHYDWATRLYTFDFETMTLGTTNKYKTKFEEYQDVYYIENGNGRLIGIGNKNSLGGKPSLYTPNADDTDITRSDITSTSYTYPVFLTQSRPYYGYVGDLLLMADNTSGGANRVYVWNREKMTYDVKTLSQKAFGIVDYNKYVSLENGNIIERTWDENYQYVSGSDRVIATNVTNCSCIWLPNEDKGIVTYTTSTRGGIHTLEYHGDIDEYVVTVCPGASTISLGGSITMPHPTGGYVAMDKHLKQLDARIRFKTPPAEGDTITIDATTRFLVKDPDLLVNFGYKLQCL